MAHNGVRPCAGGAARGDAVSLTQLYLVLLVAGAALLTSIAGVRVASRLGLPSLLLFLAVGVAYWQYGGGLALMPAFTADYFGPKNLGFNYGLVFIGWGIAFFVPQIAGYLKDATGSLDSTFYLSGSLLVAAVVLSRFLRRPQAPGELNPTAATQPVSDRLQYEIRP